MAQPGCVNLVFDGESTDVLWPLGASHGRWSVQLPDPESAWDAAGLRETIRSRSPWFAPELEELQPRGVRSKLFRTGSEGLLMLVNEDNHRHLGVDVTGLNTLEGRELKMLYGAEAATVDRGGARL